ncbi:MAG: YeeE/YedE family protein [Gammaproteobacteria bacterium]|nr:YeeE/YedE family protein [Gammaproteobacteria bacterium]
MKPASFIVILLGGMLFGFGLAVSRMIQPEVVLSFLRLQDFGLLLVLGGALTVTLVTYQLVPRILKRPLLETDFEVKRPPLNRRTIGGAAIFGIGWGLCGVCPGPAVAGLGAGMWMLILALIGIALGAYLQGRTTKL